MRQRALTPFALALLALAAVALHAPPAGATVVLEASLEDMTRVSALVVRAEVAAVTPRNEGQTGARVVTDVTLRIAEVLKGALDQDELTFTVPGGQAGGYVMHIPGMPQFQPGQEVVLFLEPTPEGYVPSGLQQGRFSVMREPVTGRKIALRTFDAGIALARRKSDGRLDISHVEDRADLLYLDDLQHRVRRTVERYGQRPEIPQHGVLPSTPAVPERAAPGAPTAPAQP